MTKAEIMHHNLRVEAEARDRFYKELIEAKTTIQSLKERNSTLTAEGAIKDRALNAAVHELNELARWVAFDLIDNDKNEDILELIGRLKDQCQNATHGELSTDPLPVSGRQEPQSTDNVNSESKSTADSRQKNTKWCGGCGELFAQCTCVDSEQDSDLQQRAPRRLDENT